MRNHPIKREGLETEEAVAQPHARKNAEKDSSHDKQKVSDRGATDPALLTNAEFSGHAHDARRAELLTELQRTYGNAYVNEFIGNQIVAARGHNSPPTTGPGSIGEPLKKGGRTTKISSMKTDAYHASPINPHNPVVVWTDGSNLFLAPSKEQVTLGRTVPTPEPVFVAPPGYSAEEIRWDRATGTSASRPLRIVARKAGAKDVEVAIDNTLQQISDFVGPGISSFVRSQTTREGAELLIVGEPTVPVEMSGGATGAINSETFDEGFLRYRAPGGTHDLYVAQGGNPFAHIVERSTGDIKQTFAKGSIAAVVPATSGVVQIETTTGSGKTTSNETSQVDLRTSPPTITKAPGHGTSEAGYDDAKKRLDALGVDITEIGLRLRVAELTAIEDALGLGGGIGLRTLQAFATLESQSKILEIEKHIGQDSATGGAPRGSVPTLIISEPFESRDLDRVATIRHELTHIIVQAQIAIRNSGLTALQRADLEGSLRWEARNALQKSNKDLLRIGELGAGTPKRGPGTFTEWRGVIGEDPEIANIWGELLRKYSFIPDPEGTGEIRGVALADESRYSGASDPLVGHPADGAEEFVASFVTSAIVFNAAFVAAVIEAETAGNARGGGGGTYLRKLYSKAWDLISARYVPLGTNPF